MEKVPFSYACYGIFNALLVFILSECCLTRLHFFVFLKYSHFLRKTNRKKWIIDIFLFNCVEFSYIGKSNNRL